MAIERLRGSDDEAVTIGQMNRLIDELNRKVTAPLGDVAGLARVSLGTVTDSSGGTAVDTVAAVPAAYSQAWVQETVATLLSRLNDLVRVNQKLQNFP